MDKKNMYRALTLVFGILLVIGVLKISYAYYALVIKGNESEYSFDLTSSNDYEVTFMDGVQLMSFDSGYFFPGDSKTKVFSVENTGKKTSKYTILLDNVINEFERTEDLQYELYINDTLMGKGNLTNEEIQYLYYGREIEVGQRDNIRFVLKYATTLESQNVDMNKPLSFRFNISDKITEQA